jgi:hypothetical protein
MDGVEDLRNLVVVNWKTKAHERLERVFTVGQDPQRVIAQIIIIIIILLLLITIIIIIIPENIAYTKKVLQSEA